MTILRYALASAAINMSINLAPLTIASPPGGGTRSYRGTTSVRVKRDPHPATQSRQPSESLKRLIRRRRG